MNTVFYNHLPQEAMRLRVTVFVDEQGFVDDVDDIDGVAVHAVMYDSGTPVATCRFFRGDTEGLWLLGRFCVSRAYRGRGIGTRLVSAVADRVRDMGGTQLLLHSQLHAEAFYAKAGFAAFGPIEYEQDSPHIWMKKEL